MRTFTTRDGTTWDAAVDRESWGSFVLIFSRRGGRDVRKVTLAAASAAEAHHELGGMSDAELQDRLDTAERMTAG